MPDRPSQLWKSMPFEKRVLAAEAFWRDTESPEIEGQQMEAVLMLARRFNFRLKSVRGLSIERRARQLARVPDLSEAIATRSLIAYHFSVRRPLMAAFLDALSIPNDNGLIADEKLDPPSTDQLAAAMATVKATFDPDDVDRYLRTLAALDADTWGALSGLLEQPQ